MRPHRVVPVLAAATLTAAVVALPTPAGAAVLAARWSMDEVDAGSRMADVSGHGHHGTRYEVGVGAPGAFGSPAYSFNGVSSRVVVPHSSAITPYNRGVEFTVLLRAPLEAPANPSVNIMQKGLALDAGGQIKIEWGGAGTTLENRPSCVFADRAGRSRRVVGPPLADGAWHTIVCTKSATGSTGRATVSIGVDGLRRASLTGPLGAISTQAPLTLGAKVYRDGRLDDQYRGLIDSAEVRIG